MKRLLWMWLSLGLLALLVLPWGIEAQTPSQGQYRVLLPSVIAAPPTVRLLDHTSTRSNGTLVVAGEVLNELPDTVYLVYVTVRGYNAAGQQVTTNSKHALLVHTPPGARNPFRVDLPDTPSLDQYDLSISWSLRNRGEFRTLTLLDEQFVINNALEVQGRVRNDDKKSIRDGRVAITFYDAANRVVDAAYAEIGEQRITSGSSATYIIHIGRAVSYSRYEIRAEGSIAPE